MKDKETARLKNLLIFASTGLIAILFLSSCATHITTRASRVRLVSALDANKVEVDCEFISNVTGFTERGCLSWGFLNRTAYNNSLNELMDNAAEMGATHVFVNLGDYHDLRGEAYRCAFCLGPDGSPDVDYCKLADGSIDRGYCQDDKGDQVGQARCEGAAGKDQAECKDMGGKWIPPINQTVCETEGKKWVPAVTEPLNCKNKGGTWYPAAKDQVTCEESKGGTWSLNPDVLRHFPEKGKGGGGK
ncbi:MAG: hypothetical protein Q8P24_12060 [Desulfobacterales bacterium]|nr:hypothetical protein [Desulfobacterales bacterium]